MLKSSKQVSAADPPLLEGQTHSLHRPHPREGEAPLIPVRPHMVHLRGASPGLKQGNCLSTMDAADRMQACRLFCSRLKSQRLLSLFTRIRINATRLRAGI